MNPVMGQHKLINSVGSRRRSCMRAVGASKRHGCKSRRFLFPKRASSKIGPTERLEECRRYDQQVPNSFQSYPPSRHHGRAGGDYYRSRGVRGPVDLCTVFSRFKHKYSRPVSKNALVHSPIFHGPSPWPRIWSLPLKRSYLS